MHEAIITRHHVERSSLDVRANIFVRQNCVLLHPGNCHILAQNYERGKRICIRHLIYWNGKEAILSWLDYLAFLHVGRAEEARHQIGGWNLWNSYGNFSLQEQRS